VGTATAVAAAVRDYSDLYVDFGLEFLLEI